jgi:hypothetical protein
MSRNPRALILAALAATWGLASTAQPVYRCGDNSYSQQPCPGGKQVDAQDARTPAQRAQTSEAVKRQAATADQMEKARLKEEARPASVGLPPPKVEASGQTADRTRPTAKAKQPKHFTATSPKKPADAAPKKTKTKAKESPA